MNWIDGRQGGGYQKLRLWESKRLRCDGWIIKYPPGSGTGEHTDPVADGFKHYRLNIVLKKAGGHFHGHPILNLWDRVILFRPDKIWHGARNDVSAYGCRYVVSVGWLTRESKSDRLRS